MTFRKVNVFGFFAILGFVTTAWAFCPEHEKEQAGQAADAAKSAVPCPHATADGATVTKAPDGSVTSGDQKAGCGKAGCGKKDCCKQKGDASLASDKGGCPMAKMLSGGKNSVDAVLASLPSMKYRVGDETTCCSKSAEQMAMKADKPIKYVVGELVFDNKGEATVALAGLLEKEIENLAAMQYSVGGKTSHCPHEAQEIAKQNNAQVAYMVAGMEFADKDKAEKAVKLATDAVATVKLSYKVGDDKFCCDKMAGAKAKDTGKTITYVVGTEETCCEQTAKLLLAQAKVKAAVEAAAGALSS